MKAIAMLYQIRRGAIFIVLQFLLSNITSAQSRDTISLNEDWVSIAGDTGSEKYVGFEKANYHTAGWEKITVPHNWDDYYGYRRLLHGNLHGTAWYKKSLHLKNKMVKDTSFFLKEWAPMLQCG